MKRRGLCGLLSVAMAAGTMAANYIPAAADELEPVTLTLSSMEIRSQRLMKYGMQLQTTQEIL